MSDYQLIIQKPKVSELIVDADLNMGTHAIKSDSAPTAGIPIDHVKLPLPEGSDYIVESVVPTEETPASVTVEQSTIIQTGIADIPNIYDASDATKAQYSEGIAFDGPLISWDLGQIYKSLYLSVKLGGYNTDGISRLEMSLDGESWTTFATITGTLDTEETTSLGEIVSDVRHLRWWGVGPGSGRRQALYYLRIAEVYYVATPTPTIAAGLKITFGASQTVTPAISTNGTEYTDLEPLTGITSVWTFPAQYVQKVRWCATDLPTGTLSLYERITDRVAAEHGHGSGIVDALHTPENFGSRGVVLGAGIRGTGSTADRLIVLEEIVKKLAQMVD
ncbi:hypothetical protein ES707_11335 [subsurface metagenome]